MKKVFFGALLLVGGVYNFVIANSDRAKVAELNVDGVENMAEGFELFGLVYYEKELYWKEYGRGYFAGHWWTFWNCVEGKETQWKPFQECQKGEQMAISLDGSIVLPDDLPENQR